MGPKCREGLGFLGKSRCVHDSMSMHVLSVWSPGAALVPRWSCWSFPSLSCCKPQVPQR